MGVGFSPVVRSAGVGFLVGLWWGWFWLEVTGRSCRSGLDAGSEEAMSVSVLLLVGSEIAHDCERGVLCWTFRRHGRTCSRY